MAFEILGKIGSTETIAQGASIREKSRLVRFYGKGNWEKKKGIAIIRSDDGQRAKVELHWHEAHGIGKREFKFKSIIEWLDS